MAATYDLNPRASLGSCILSQRLTEVGIQHRYAEFDDGHSDIDYRMDVSLPFLYQALRQSFRAFAGCLPARKRGNAWKCS